MECKRNEKLRHARGRHMQAWVAEQIGASPESVSRWERGVVYPQLYYLERLCALFHCSAEDLGFSHVRSTTKESVCSDPMLPHHPPLFGRETESENVKALLQHGERRFAFNGIPGIGKTALTTALAHDPDVHRCFPDGVLWAELGPNPDYDAIWQRWASLLHVASEEEYPHGLKQALAHRSMLIVIDDAWTVEAALTLLQVSGPTCGIILTTRFPGVAATVTPHAIALQELEEHESLQLLFHLAPLAKENEGLGLSQQLVRKVGGLPLAITLLGNYMRTVSYQAPHRRMLVALQRLLDAHHRLSIANIVFESIDLHTVSLASVIETSVRSLSSEARNAFSTLSMLSTTFSEEEALAIGCRFDDLDALLDVGLVSVHHDRYHMHCVVADYAAMNLSAEKRTEAKQQRIRYALALLHAEEEAAIAQHATMIASAVEDASTMDYWNEAISLIRVYLARIDTSSSTQKPHKGKGFTQRKPEPSTQGPLYQPKVNHVPKNAHAPVPT